MSDAIKHECGIALVRLLKPIEYYVKKYGTAFYGLQKTSLLIEKQHNRGQDGAGIASVKFDVSPGTKYINRVRSNSDRPIRDVLSKINRKIEFAISQKDAISKDLNWDIENLPFLGNLFLGHVRYGTFGVNSIESVHPFVRSSNWRHKNLIVAGNFNMTNSSKLFQDLVDIGQHPIERTDTVTVLEKIAHFLDDQVDGLYQKSLEQSSTSQKEISPIIEKNINLESVLKNSAKNWDGGYAMAGLLGHGDCFVLRDPASIRPAYYYKDDEVVVVASERPAIQTAFNVKFDDVKELPGAHALIVKKDGTFSISQILPQLPKKSCSFERIYFSRGSDAEIYNERKELGKLVFPQILEIVDKDLKNSVFSYIPNTAETSFYGIIEAAEDHLNTQKLKIILENKNISKEALSDVLSQRPRFEKIAIKDAKLRTFITSDSNRDDLVAHVYDVTYGVVKADDNLVIIDDSIVRGTTLKKSIIRILDRLNPKRIVVVSSAPQIRYPDCYGIDMARLGDFIAFKAAIALLNDIGKQSTIESVYEKCIAQTNLNDDKVENFVKEIYLPFTDAQISKKIGELLTLDSIKSEVNIIYQSVENLHKACPKHKGDWYFTGDFPTPGGNRVVNRAFIHFYEGNTNRAY